MGVARYLLCAPRLSQHLCAVLQVSVSPSRMPSPKDVAKAPPRNQGRMTRHPPPRARGRLGVSAARICSTLCHPSTRCAHHPLHHCALSSHRLPVRGRAFTCLARTSRRGPPVSPTSHGANPPCLVPGLLRPSGHPSVTVPWRQGGRQVRMGPSSSHKPHRQPAHSHQGEVQPYTAPGCTTTDHVLSPYGLMTAAGQCRPGHVHQGRTMQPA